MTVIGEHGDQFVERDVFTHLALGVVAATRRFGRLVGRYGTSDSRDAGSDARDAILIDLTLGLLSFGRRVEAIVRALPLPSSASAAAPAAVLSRPLR